MQYFMTVLLIFAGIIKRNSKIIFYLQTIWLIILTGANTLSPDIRWLISEYNHAGPVSAKDLFLNEGIYETTQFIFRKAGFTFPVYLMFFSVVSIVLLVRGITYIAKTNRCFVLSMIMIYPLMQLIIQFNNRMSIAIVIFGIHYLLKKNWKGILKYCLCILLAMGFHTSAIFYIILILGVKLSKTQVVKLTMITLVGVGFLIPALPGLLTILPFHNARIYDYFVKEDLRLAWYKGIGLAIWQLSGCILMCFALGRKYLVTMGTGRIGAAENADKLKCDMLYKINMIMCLNCILYYYNYMFSRLWRYFLPVLYAAIGQTFINSKGSFRRNYLGIFIVLAYALASFLYFDIIWGNNSHYYIMVMENNWIFNLFK